MHCDDDYIDTIASTISDGSLRHTICYGIGLHHAGLSSHDRETVERMFLNGDVQILVATATLAWGGSSNCSSNAAFHFTSVLFSKIILVSFKSK